MEIIKSIHDNFWLKKQNSTISFPAVKTNTTKAIRKLSTVRRHPAGPPCESWWQADRKENSCGVRVVSAVTRTETKTCDLFFRNISTASSNMPRTSKSITAQCPVRCRSSPEPSPPGTPTRSVSRRRRRRESRRRGWGDSWWGAPNQDKSFWKSCVLINAQSKSYGYTGWLLTILATSISQLMVNVFVASK